MRVTNHGFSCRDGRNYFMIGKVIISVLEKRSLGNFKKASFSRLS